MPRLPSAADLGERPGVSVGGGVASYQVPSGGAPGAAITRAGATVSAAADDFGRLVKEEEKRVNTTRAEEAFNKLRERQLDLTVGDDGFVNRRGGDAINQPLLKDFGDRFDNVSKEIEGELANDEQRDLFRRRAGVSGLQFREDLLRHIRSEGDVHAKNVFEGGVSVEIRNATARWQDPTAVSLSIERIAGLVDQAADRGGWAAEQKQAELLKRTSAVHSSVIGQALATDNYAFAQQWYEANKDQIDPVTAKAVQKAVVDGAEKQLYAGYTREYLGAQNDMTSLQDLEKRVSADPALDDTRRNALLGRIQSRGEMLYRRAEVAEQKLLRRVERAIGDVRGNLLAGFEPTPEQLSPILNAAKGTELEGEAAALVAGANATRAFRNSLPAAQEVMITQAEAAVRKDPSTFDRRILESWRTINENQKRRVAESPVTFAVQQGLIDPQSPAARPLDLSNPTAAAEGISARFELGRAMARAYNAPFKPLTTEEASLAVNQLKSATVAQKREWFGAVHQAANGDAAGYSAIMAQIAPDAPVLAIAGEYAGKGRTQAADLLLRGESILRPNRKEDGSPDGGKLLPMPPEKGMREIFDDGVRDAYAGMPQARSDHFQAARAIYAALSADAGDRDTGALDTDRWEQAIQLATGGVREHRGRRIPMPYGFEPSQFKDGLARRVEDIVESGRLGPEWTKQRLLSLPLQAVGDGRYAFMVGDSLLGAEESSMGRYSAREPTESERAWFEKNKNVGGMAAKDGKVVLNPFSNLSSAEKEAVAKNERFRLLMRDRGITPSIDVTPEQRKQFAGTPYEGNESAMKQTIVARILSGDPSARATDAQVREARAIESRATAMRPLIIDFETSVPFRTSGHGLRAAIEEPTAAELQEAAKSVTGRALARKKAPAVPASAAKPSFRSGVNGAMFDNDSPPPARIVTGGVRG